MFILGLKKKYKILFGVLLGLFIVFFGVSCCVIGISDCAVAKDYFDGAANPYIADGTAMVSAHRAGSLVAPENTLNAFRLGIEEAKSGGFTVDIWEFDLHITKDNELILLHDHTLDRTSNSEEVFGTEDARPEDYTLEELRRLNMGYDFELNGEYPFRNLTEEEVSEQGLRVCTLDEVLDFMTSEEASAAVPAEYGKFRYVIEVKNSGKLGEKAADLLYDTLTEYGILQDVVFGTFNQNVTNYVDETYPDMLRSSSICEVLDFWFAFLTKADLSKRGVGYCALQIPYSKTISFLGNRELIEYAHSYNIAVQYWTINEADDVEYLQSIGADCIMSDSPDMCYDILRGGE